MRGIEGRYGSFFPFRARCNVLHFKNTIYEPNLRESGARGGGGEPFQDLVSNACCSVVAGVIPAPLFQAQAYNKSDTHRGEGVMEALLEPNRMKRYSRYFDFKTGIRIINDVFNEINVMHLLMVIGSTIIIIVQTSHA